MNRKLFWKVALVLLIISIGMSNGIAQTDEPPPPADYTPEKPPIPDGLIILTPTANPATTDNVSLLDTIKRIFLSVVYGGRSIPTPSPLPVRWEITEVIGWRDWYGLGPKYWFKLEAIDFPGYTVLAYCKDQPLDQPWVGKYCDLQSNGVLNCGVNLQRLQLVIVTTPTPTSTPTSTMTPTATRTPTSTPTRTPCPSVCPLLRVDYEYPVGTFRESVPFLLQPDWGWGSLTRLFAPNELRATIIYNNQPWTGSWFGGLASVVVTLHGPNGQVVNISPRAQDLRWNVGCGDINFSTAVWNMHNVLTIQTPCGVQICQSGKDMTDPTVLAAIVQTDDMNFEQIYNVGRAELGLPPIDLDNLPLPQD